MQAPRGHHHSERLYVIGPPSVSLAKIGASGHPGRRLMQLRTRGEATQFPRGLDRGRLVLLYEQDGGRALEKLLHQWFADQWVAGEWFDLGANAVERIRAAVASLHRRGLTAYPPAAASTPAEPLPSPRRPVATPDHRLAAARLAADVSALRAIPVCPPRRLVYS